MAAWGGGSTFPNRASRMLALPGSHLGVRTPFWERRHLGGKTLAWGCGSTVPSRASRMQALPGSHLGGIAALGSAAILAARPWLGMRLHRPQQGQQDAGAPRKLSWRHCGSWERRHLGGKTLAGNAAPPSPAGPAGCRRSQGAILAVLRLLGAPPSWRQDLGLGCGSTVLSRASRMLALPGSYLGVRTPFGSAAILAARPWLGMRLHRPQQGQQDAGAPREPSWERHCGSWEQDAGASYLGGKTLAWDAAPPSPTGPAGCRRSQEASWRQDLGLGGGSTLGQQDAGAPRKLSWRHCGSWERHRGLLLRLGELRRHVSALDLPCRCPR